jgi:hypothetical protein
VEARCVCGDLILALPGPTKAVSACHCKECQRRTGSPFGVGAYYDAGEVRVTGPAKTYSRSGQSGALLTFSFCPRCGSNVFWSSSAHPQRLGVAVGSIADPDFPAPKTSLWEETMHLWLSMEGVQEHHPGARER